MKMTLIPAIAAATILSIFSNPVSAQSADGVQTLAEYNAQHGRQPATVGVPIEAASYGPAPERMPTIYEPRLDRSICERYGNTYHPRLGCQIPADRRTVWSPRPGDEVRQTRYPAPASLPTNLPSRIFKYPQAAHDLVTGERLYIDLVMEHGPLNGRVEFLEVVEDQRQVCMQARRPSRPSNYNDSRSEYGMSYRDRGGPFMVYSSRRVRQPIITPTERDYEDRMAIYSAIEGLCEDFNEEYERHNRFR